MKKHNIGSAICLCSMMAFCACGQVASLPDEPYEAVDYTLYPAPPDAYVGDTMPFVTDDGQLELYYLYDTDHNGQGYHPVYKYTTTDLCGYEDHGQMLEFGLMSDPDPAIGTGSVMQDQDGLYHLFYTGHNDVADSDTGKECVMHATSTDRENWTKIPEDTFYAPKGYSRDDFRDPEVFWVDEEQCYWMLIAARSSQNGEVAKFTSTDLSHWEFCGPFYNPQEQYMLECPDLFKMGDKYYLTYSWDCVTYYAMSDSLNGPFTAPEDNVLDGSGFIFYAAKTAELDGKRFLCGWLGRAALPTDTGKYQWAGNVLNHQLIQLEDGRLGVQAPETYDTYFTNEKEFKAVKKQGKVSIKNNSISLSAGDDEVALADMGTRAPSMTLECDVTLDNDGCAGFAFGGSENDESYTAFCLDAAQSLLHYEGTDINELDQYPAEAYTHFVFSKKDVHHVKLVCENEIVVLYIDNEKALSSRVFHSVNGAHIGVFSQKGSTEFSNIKMMLN